MLSDALSKTKSGLVTTVFDTTDRIQHMFFRYLDPKHPANAGKDVVTAQGRGRAGLLTRGRDGIVRGACARSWNEKNTVLVVMSDHGFKQFQRGVNLNALAARREGYLVLKDGKRTAGGDWFEGIDWSKTRAFGDGAHRALPEPQGAAETRGIVKGHRDREAARAQERDRGEAASGSPTRSARERPRDPRGVRHPPRAHGP